MKEGSASAAHAMARPHRAGTKVTPIAGAIDLLPTLADLAGIPVVSSKPLDGVSVAPLLRGDPNTGWPDRRLFSHWNGKVSVRSQQYRLDASGRLYDMTVDPGQEKDIAKDRPEIAAQLRAAVARWSQELLPGLTNDNRPFPVGYRAFPSRGCRRATGWPMVTSSGARVLLTALTLQTGRARTTRSPGMWR